MGNRLRQLLLLYLFLCLSKLVTHAEITNSLFTLHLKYAFSWEAYDANASTSELPYLRQIS